MLRGENADLSGHLRRSLGAIATQPWAIVGVRCRHVWPLLTTVDVEFARWILPLSVAGFALAPCGSAQR